MSLVSLNHNSRSYFYLNNQTRKALSDEVKSHFDEGEFKSHVSEILKKRHNSDIEIEHISKITKISNKNLRLIEQLSFDSLPPMPVKKAIILQYCRLVQSLVKIQSKTYK